MRQAEKLGFANAWSFETFQTDAGGIGRDVGGEQRARTLLAGRGYRTNSDGIWALERILGVETLVFDLPHFHGPGEVMHLMSVLSPLDRDLLNGHEIVGLTAGASTPEGLVQAVLTTLAGRGYDEVEEITVAREDVHFRLPREVHA